MDPYLEHPALWPDFHNSLIAAIANALGPALRPNCYVALRCRTYNFRQQDLALMGVPDVPCTQADLPIRGGIRETFLEICRARSNDVVTVVEALSHATRIHPGGREEYLAVRDRALQTGTNFVELDLLRTGEPSSGRGRERCATAYCISVAKRCGREETIALPFSLRHPIPSFQLPLLPGDEEPELDLNRVLHELYERASFDLRLDYSQPALPPLTAEDAAWAAEQVRQAAAG
jgi:hypothetical protein